MLVLLWQFLRGHSRGQSLVEYALLFVLILVVVIVVAAVLGPQIAAGYRNIESAV